MNQKTQKKQLNRQLQDYGEWLFSELKKQGIDLEVVGNGLRVKGEITAAQKEFIRIWKRQLIEAASPKCRNCNLAMDLIEDGKLWFCPVGCESREK